MDRLGGGRDQEFRPARDERPPGQTGLQAGVGQEKPGDPAQEQQQRCQDHQSAQHLPPEHEDVDERRQLDDQGGR